MSTFRQRWRVVIDGGQPIEVTTTAWDNVGLTMPVPQNGHDPEVPWEMPYRIVHNALVRTEAPGVPRHFRDFAMVLDEADVVEDDRDPGSDDVDPTHAAVSGD